MARPKNPNKKEKEELIVRTPSEPFYKAFLFPSNAEEMIVDVSGDSFSYTMEQAVLAALYKLPWDELCKIPMAHLFAGTGEPDEEVDISEISTECMGDIVLMMVRAHHDAEFEAGKIPLDDVVEGSDAPMEFMFRMKALSEGYTIGLQDYMIQNITMHKPNDGSDYKITKCELRIDDVKHKNAAFPDVLNVV